MQRRHNETLYADVVSDKNYVATMGCASTKHFVPNDAIPGQGEEVFKIFKILNLNPDDIDKLYSAFRAVDIDNSGTIQQAEMGVFLRIEKSKFSDMAFSVFDEDKR